MQPSAGGAFDVLGRAWNVLAIHLASRGRQAYQGSDVIANTSKAIPPERALVLYDRRANARLKLLKAAAGSEGESLVVDLAGRVMKPSVSEFWLSKVSSGEITQHEYDTILDTWDRRLFRVSHPDFQTGKEIFLENAVANIEQLLPEGYPLSEWIERMKTSAASRIHQCNPCVEAMSRSRFRTANDTIVHIASGDVDFRLAVERLVNEGKLVAAKELVMRSWVGREVVGTQGQDIGAPAGWHIVTIDQFGYVWDNFGFQGKWGI